MNEATKSGCVKVAENLPEESRIQESWKRHSKILSLRNNIGLGFIQLGKELYEFNDNRLYLEQGCDSFEEYIASIGLSRSTVFAWKSIYKVFVLKHHVPEMTLAHIPWSKLEKIKHRVTEDNLEDMLFMARELSITDLQREANLRVFRTYEVCECCGGLITKDTIKICRCEHSEEAGSLISPQE